jgi:hypothetical protein
MTQTIQKHAPILSKSPTVRFTGKYIEDAPLYFGNGTQDIDQKRGLSINGPSDSKTDVIYTIRVGIVSTGQGIQETSSFLEYINNNVIPSSGKKPFATQSFPGFSKAFRCKLVLSSDYNQEILSKEVQQLLEVRNPETRIKRAAEKYAEKVGVVCRRVSGPEVIICHEPQNIEDNCGAGMKSTKNRPILTRADKKEAAKIRKTVETHMMTLAPLSESTQNLLDMAVHQDFRRVLKSKCLAYDIPTQILTQTILHRLKTEEPVEPPQESSDGQKKIRKIIDRSSLAWNLAAAIYYKANHFPWKVGYLKSGTCYVGIAFYQDKTKRDKTMCASLAQVFSDTGEGMVVRGRHDFKWDTEELGDPHLTEENAFEVLADAISVYKEHHDNQFPNRIVIHKSSMYLDDERRGFMKACADVPKYDFISVSDGREVFFYRNGEKAVLRGTCISLENESFLVYTKGYVPYQRAYLGPRVPKPLEITQHFGDTTQDEIAKEIMALSRLDWNTADYSSYLPITLKCAYKVGEVLGLVRQGDPIKQQYKFYM